MSGNTHTDVLLAGALAAFTVDLLVYPLDTIKTRYQSPDYKKLYYNASRTAVDRRLLFRGVYQGVGSVILATVPSAGAFFTTYEALKSGLNKLNSDLGRSNRTLVPQAFVDSASSAGAELVSCLILTPAEVLKQNAQMIQVPKNAAGSKASTIFQPSVSLQAFKQFQKPSQLFRGYTALAARNLPFTAMQFPMFEHLKRYVKEERRKNGKATGTILETAVITAVSAGSAGSVAAVITTPVDVVKTRIMLSAAGEGSEAETKKQVQKAQAEGQTASSLAAEKGAKRKSSLAVAREVMRESGVKGLFRGGLLRGTWTALGSGLYLGVYESGRAWLEGRRTEAA